MCYWPCSSSRANKKPSCTILSSALHLLIACIILHPPHAVMATICPHWFPNKKKNISLFKHYKNTGWTSGDIKSGQDLALNTHVWGLTSRRQAAQIHCHVIRRWGKNEGQRDFSSSTQPPIHPSHLCKTPIPPHFNSSICFLSFLSAFFSFQP